MKYRYRYWCGYCYGSDYPICEGYDESDETFDTPGLADGAAREYIEDTGYDYCIIDENGSEVEESEALQ